VARNRYGWEKRAKEIARKQKHEEKLKRRQYKRRLAEEIPASEEEMGEVPSENPEDAS